MQNPNTHVQLKYLLGREGASLLLRHRTNERHMHSFPCQGQGERRWFCLSLPFFFHRLFLSSFTIIIKSCKQLNYRYTVMQSGKKCVSSLNNLRTVLFIQVKAGIYYVVVFLVYHRQLKLFPILYRSHISVIKEFVTATNYCRGIKYLIYINQQIHNQSCVIQGITNIWHFLYSPN